jgi:mercuric ion transport protein
MQIGSNQVQDKTVLKTGIIGTVIAVICCFTPFLVVVLGAVGLSAWLGWLDYVLLPALAVCIVILGYGIYRVSKHSGGSKETP